MSDEMNRWLVVVRVYVFGCLYDNVHPSICPKAILFESGSRTPEL